MIVDNIQFAGFCKNLKIDDKSVRRKIEDSLSEFTFSFFTSPPSPNIEIVSDLIGYTEHRHSRLQISGNLAKLLMTFDKDFRNDFEKSLGYAYEKIKSVSRVLADIDANFYSGIVIQYLFQDARYTDNVIDFINHNSVKIIGNERFFGFGKNFSLVHDDRFYLNFSISSLKPRDGSDLILGVSVDINNRYSSEIKEQSVGYDDIDCMKQLHCHIAKVVLERLLTKGELDLNEKF